MTSIKKTLPKIIGILIVILFFIICAYPIIWMVLCSLKGEGEFYTNIWGLPETFVFDNYVKAWQQGGLGQKFLNSFLVTAGAIILMIPVNCCAAYAIGRLKFKMRSIIYIYLLLGIMIPSGVLGIPNYQVCLALGLNNSLFGLCSWLNSDGCIYYAGILYIFATRIGRGCNDRWCYQISMLYKDNFTSC